MTNVLTEVSMQAGGTALADKIAVVTGASTGIGRAIAKRFVAEGAHVFITGRRQAQSRAVEWLARLEVEDVRHKRPGEISGGQGQRVAVARALVNRPRLLLADEPTGNLDSATGAEVMAVILDHVARAGMSLVLVTHDADLARRSSDRAVTMVDGRL